MKHPTSLCNRHRLPSEIIQDAVWRYHRFSLSHGDIEELLTEKGFPSDMNLSGSGATGSGQSWATTKAQSSGIRKYFFICEVLIRIQGKQSCRRRVFDQDGKVVDVLFNPVHHHLSAKNIRMLRLRVFASWKSAVVAKRQIQQPSVRSERLTCHYRFATSRRPRTAETFPAGMRTSPPSARDSTLTANRPITAGSDTMARPPRCGVY